ARPPWDHEPRKADPGLGAGGARRARGLGALLAGGAGAELARRLHRGDGAAEHGVPAVLGRVPEAGRAALARRRGDRLERDVDEPVARARSGQLAGALVVAVL